MKKTVILAIMVICIATISTSTQQAKPMRNVIRAKKVDAETQKLIDSLNSYSDSIKQGRVKAIMSTILLKKRIQELKKQDSILNITKQ